MIDKNQAVEQNLLLITFDQLRADWCDPFEKYLRLPNLRAIAQKGITYKRCYTTSPQCVPARLSWLTGKMPSTVGITRNVNCSIRENIPSVFRQIRNRGWHTELIGKHTGRSTLKKETYATIRI